jgi:hypothetical protein
MATGYTVVPLTDEIRDHLRDLGLDVHLEIDGRHPTPSEVRATIRELGLKLETHGPWETGTSAPWWGTISETGDESPAPWAAIVLSNVQSDDLPAELGFERGWSELIVRLIVALAPRAGPLVLFDDAGSPPLVVTGRLSAPELLRHWT